jgi:hypothetical protein
MPRHGPRKGFSTGLGGVMTEDEVRRAFDAIDGVASGRMSREEAIELFDQCLTAHDLAATARAALPSGRRHGRPSPASYSHH